MKKSLLLILLCVSARVFSQDVVGYWYGTASVANGGGTNNYLVELILKQNGGTVNGIINYYFKNTFRSFKTSGSFNSNSRELSLFNIPLTYFGSTAQMEVDCPMDLRAQLRVAKAGSNLAGSFISKAAYKHTCPPVNFNIKLNKDAKNQDSILTALRQFKETYQVWSPSASDTLVAATVIQRPITNYVVANQYKEREKVLAQEIEINSDSLSLDFYDNGEIDGDSISIFYNDKLLASSQRLSARSIHLKVAVDTTKEYNEVTMFADNLGTIPPNTALMLVSDGRKRYEVRLSSSLQKSGTVRFKRRTK
jgi:hypothetical protein